ncbi:MAG: replicative DNA helicase [Lachnospiraceae bacterium]|nr:replicative DNA helicase [Lachnospiraceae bacterium]
MDENVIKRIQPHNNEAEQAILGSILMDRDVISEISDKLSREDFYNAQYGIIYESMKELYNEGKEIDVISLSNKLKTKDVPEEISSLANLSNIISAVPVSANAKEYAQIVADDSVLRKLIKISENISKDCYLSKESVEVLLNEAEQNIFRLVQGRSGSGKFKETKEIILEVLEDIEKAARNKGQFTGLPTGFKDLDNLLTGMNGGELILVAARPAMGKTAFVLNIVHNLAVMKNIPCVIFSLEMSRKQLMSRIVAMDAMVDSKDLKLGTLSDDDWDKVIESADVLGKAPIYIEADYAVTLSDLRSRCRYHKQNNDIKLIVLDYLQLMSTTKNVESRQQFISDISRGLKNLSIELDVPIIALSQLSRAVDSRTDHKPVLSDLRESGAIEQDADVVMFIYRDEYYNPENTTKPNTAEINIAKHRNGEVGSVDLRWIGKYTKFADPEKYYNAPN